MTVLDNVCLAPVHVLGRRRADAEIRARAQLLERAAVLVEGHAECRGHLEFFRLPAQAASLGRDGAVDIAPEAIQSARRVIEAEYGKQYVPSSPRQYTSKAKNAQEAHEAIRPTDLARLPSHVKKVVEPDQAKLYELIWLRTIASQMESAELERTTVDIVAKVGARTLERFARDVH